MKNDLTEEQARKLLAAVRGHPLEAIITLALVTGMRRDELLHLKWRDLDLQKREVRVRNTKTQHGERIIPLSPRVSRMLTQHATRQLESRLAAGPAWQHDDLVFPYQVGKQLRPEDLLQGWYALLEQAGLPPLLFHDLRLARWRKLAAWVRAARGRPDTLAADSLDLEGNAFPDRQEATCQGPSCTAPARCICAGCHQRFCLRHVIDANEDGWTGETPQCLCITCAPLTDLDAFEKGDDEV
jgi:Phage integrase family